MDSQPKIDYKEELTQLLEKVEKGYAFVPDSHLFRVLKNKLDATNNVAPTIPLKSTKVEKPSFFKRFSKLLKRKPTELEIEALNFLKGGGMFTYAEHMVKHQTEHGAMLQEKSRIQRFHDEYEYFKHKKQNNPESFTAQDQDSLDFCKFMSTKYQIIKKD